MGFDETIDSIMQMDFDSREMLIEILLKRQSEVRRKNIARHAIQAKADYKKGKLHASSATEVLSVLNKEMR